MSAPDAVPHLERASSAFGRALADPEGAQEDLLRSILIAASSTVFGREHGFAECRTLSEYRQQVSPMAYADLSPYIDRTLAGEPDVLFPGPCVFFARTSGTTGRPKHVPFSARTAEEYWSFIGPSVAALDRDYPGTLRHMFHITGKYHEDRTPTGVCIGSASGYVRRALAELEQFACAPEPVFEETRFDPRYYALLLFALSKPLRGLGTPNPSTLITLFAHAAKHGEALADDLERGTCEAGPEGASELVRPWLHALPRSPEVARRLRASLSANGRFVPLDVWPDLKVFTTWKGGHTRHYLRSLAERCPGVTLRSNVSGSSEAALLVPLRDDWSGGVPALTSTVFELLPEGAEPTPDGFVDLADVKEGEGYRLCVTNSRGMYRYLMEDVFEVEGFERRVPILSFSHRVGLVSSLTGEKLTEEDVLTAVDHAFGALRVRDFQVAAEWGEPPRYLVLVELEHDEPSEEVLITALRGFEEALCAGNSEYESKRRSDRLGDPELLLLEPGAFDRAKRDAAAGRGDAQIKVPRLRRDLVSRDSIAVIRAVRLPVPLR